MKSRESGIRLESTDAMAKEGLKEKSVLTPKFRMSFPKLDKAVGFNGGEPRFSITMLFDKNTDLTAMKNAAIAAKTERWGTDPAKWPKKRLKNGKIVSALKSPFRDGDLEKPDMEGYRNCIFVTASSKEDDPPGMINHAKERIDAKELYAGCYARATLIAFAYPRPGEKGFGNAGISFALRNIQKLGEGKKFSGKKDPEDEFDAVVDESEDEASYTAVDEGEMEADDATDDLGF